MILYCAFSFNILFEFLNTIHLYACFVVVFTLEDFSEYCISLCFPDSQISDFEQKLPKRLLLSENSLSKFIWFEQMTQDLNLFIIISFSNPNYQCSSIFFTAITFKNRKKIIFKKTLKSTPHYHVRNSTNCNASWMRQRLHRHQEFRCLQDYIFHLYSHLISFLHG